MWSYLVGYSPANRPLRTANGQNGTQHLIHSKHRSKGLKPTLLSGYLFFRLTVPVTHIIIFAEQSSRNVGENFVGIGIFADAVWLIHPHCQYCARCMPCIDYFVGPRFPRRKGNKITCCNRQIAPRGFEGTRSLHYIEHLLAKMMEVHRETSVIGL